MANKINEELLQRKGCNINVDYQKNGNVSYLRILIAQ